jgi:hypothetical protein
MQKADARQAHDAAFRLVFALPKTAFGRELSVRTEKTFNFLKNSSYFSRSHFHQTEAFTLR